MNEQDLALAAIDEEIRYNQRMTQVFGGDDDLIDVGKAYANRAKLWQALKGRLERLEDAVATRITAKAAEEAGVEHPGADMIGGHRKGETWQQFVARIRKCCSR